MILSLRRAAVALTCAWAAQAGAQSLADPQWNALLEADRSAELQKLAQARLQAQPDDPQATLALALLAMGANDPQRVEGALVLADKCLQRQPAAAVCHFATGSLLGVQAVTGGMLKAMTLTGRIRDAFAKAVELDPLYFNARDGLVQFYLLAPGIAGGSVSKAREVAAGAQARQPEHAKLLRARIAMKEEQWAEAERELASVRVGADTSLASDVRDAWGQLGSIYLHNAQPAKARPVFERLQREYAAHALGFYGLARVLGETGAHDEAIAQLERARTLQGADRLPVDYRLALAWLQKGDKARAKPLLERFVSQGKGHPNNLGDAKKRLAELG
ncbi:tetratricopeptide repeat protein [Ideonella sp. BN130291]|uniref:tetratricopeptide repeat protein n=1 Tax=Ideonella sp. BN130291 TaxID=3112940 RepID=UPI002E26E731|nr:tetratricopeptide repeat protein [Ideonella sp. BN130291]